MCTHKPITHFSSLAIISLVLLAVVSCKKKDPFTITKAEMVSEMQQNKNFDKLVTYGKSIGIDKEVNRTSEQDLMAYLEEIGFGHKPEHIRHIEKEKTVDTLKIWMAAWELAQGQDVAEVLAKVEPPYQAYKQLKNHHLRLMETGQADSARVVARALNTYRWIHRQAQGSERLVLVNTRGAYLKAMDSLGNEALQMKVIVGKSKTPTPGIDTYATNVVTYPYWNVPKSIAIGEMLPRIQENVYYLERNGIEVLDQSGNVVDQYSIDWSQLTQDHFPYRFRQETGEDNSLGVMKVNIENPYAIYLHDTNARTLFTSEERWKSHGCVRLENPAQLANFIAGEPFLKETFIEDAIAMPEKDRKPSTHKLDKKVPVFIYYMPADVDPSGNLVFYKDVYGWDKDVS
jgi:L,D-transpeptidase YcbB